MSGKYVYLSMIPESLVASMLPPEQFGTYLAVGTRKRSRGQAIFFDLKDTFDSDYFDFHAIEKECVPHPSGQPKNSLYLAIYRVLEHVPLEMLNSLWLVTRDGKVLELKQGEVPSGMSDTYHLYQDICPVHPRIASSLDPVDYCKFVTDPDKRIYVPRICFVDLQLEGLANDPEHAEVNNLPYEEMDHLRDCLKTVGPDSDKHTKTVDRIHPQEFPYRCIRTGFYVGDKDNVLYYPFPSHHDLENTYYHWWRSASAWE